MNLAYGSYGINKNDNKCYEKKQKPNYRRLKLFDFIYCHTVSLYLYCLEIPRIACVYLNVSRKRDVCHCSVATTNNDNDDLSVSVQSSLFTYDNNRYHWRHPTIITSTEMMTSLWFPKLTAWLRERNTNRSLRNSAFAFATVTNTQTIWHRAVANKIPRNRYYELWRT